jgi:hypothetical protein
MRKLGRDAYELIRLKTFQCVSSRTLHQVNSIARWLLPCYRSVCGLLLPRCRLEFVSSMYAGVEPDVKSRARGVLPSRLGILDGDGDEVDRAGILVGPRRRPCRPQLRVDDRQCEYAR